MNTFLKLYIAELREFSRDRTALFFTLAFPLIFIVMFGTIFSTGGGSLDAAVGVVNADEGAVGAMITGDLEAMVAAPPPPGQEKNPLADMTIETGPLADLETKIAEGDLDALVVIPAGTSAAIEAGQPTAVEIRLDQSNTSQAAALQALLTGVVDRTDRQIAQAPPRLRAEVRSVLSDSLRGIDFLLPGIIGMSLMQLGLFATAQPLIAARTQGVLKRLGATPLPRWMLMLSYIALRLTMVVIQMALLIGVGMLLFDASVVGSYMALVGWVLLGALMFISIGFFIAAVAKTEESGTAITNLVNFPMLFLSGVFFPVDALPTLLQPVIKALPLTYTVDALRQTMIDAPPINPAWLNFAVQGAWLAVMALLAVRFFKWESR